MNIKKRLAVFLFIIITVVMMGTGEKITLSVNGADIKDVLMLLTKQSGMNVVPADDVRGRVTINLENVTLEEALDILDRVYDFTSEKIKENTYMVHKKEKSKKVEKNKIFYENGKITFDIRDGNVREILNRISKVSGVNIVMDSSVVGRISGSVHNVDLETGLKALLTANNFSIEKQDDIYKVKRAITKKKIEKNLKVTVKENKVSLDAQNANLYKVLNEISQKSDMDIVLMGGGNERVTIQLKNYKLDNAIEKILSGTKYGYKKEGNIILVGNKTKGSSSYDIFSETQVIKLQYIQAEKVPSLLSSNHSGLDIKVISEQNALSVTGVEKDIERLKKYMEKIDKKVPQIAVNALIIEISKSENTSTRTELLANYKDTGDSIVNSPNGEFKFDESKFNIFKSGGLDFNSVTKLSADFYANLKVMIQEGNAKIKASPTITTINGEQAILDVGTIQYYKIVTLDENGKEKVDYKSVDAGVTLDVTPWISSSGDITLKLSPTISNIGGASVEGPPDISRREAQTTVRVKDGETIIIGGLVQNVVSEKVTGIPILKDIPILGNLFKKRGKDINQTELIMYITPKILKEDNGEKVKKSIKEMLGKLDWIEDREEKKK